MKTIKNIISESQLVYEGFMDPRIEKLANEFKKSDAKSIRELAVDLDLDLGRVTPTDIEEIDPKDYSNIDLKKIKTFTKSYVHVMLFSAKDIIFASRERLTAKLIPISEESKKKLGDLYNYRTSWKLELQDPKTLLNTLKDMGIDMVYIVKQNGSYRTKRSNRRMKQQGVWTNTPEFYKEWAENNMAKFNKLIAKNHAENKNDAKDIVNEMNKVSKRVYQDILPKAYLETNNHDVESYVKMLLRQMEHITNNIRILYEEIAGIKSWASDYTLQRIKTRKNDLKEMFAGANETCDNLEKLL